MNFIPQFIPYWDEAEVKAVNKVMKSDYLNEHKTVREFEKKFANDQELQFKISARSNKYLGEWAGSK